MLPILAVTLAEAFLLQRSFFTDTPFRTVALCSAAVNFVLLGIHNFLIWPFFLNPLRHLPSAPVRPPFSSSDMLTTQGTFNMVRFIFDNPRGRLPLQWMKTVPNDGLIHFRDLLNQSQLLATNHQALLDIMSTHTYDFEKPWRAREFLARIIGFGLILSEGAAHKKQRKALTPSFHMKNVRALYALMWDKTDQLLAELDKEVSLHPMDEESAENGWGRVEMSVWARYFHSSN